MSTAKRKEKSREVMQHWKRDSLCNLHKVAPTDEGLHTVPETPTWTFSVGKLKGTHTHTHTNTQTEKKKEMVGIPDCMKR